MAEWVLHCTMSVLASTALYIHHSIHRQTEQHISSSRFQSAVLKARGGAFQAPELASAFASRFLSFSYEARSRPHTFRILLVCLFVCLFTYPDIKCNPTGVKKFNRMASHYRIGKAKRRPPPHPPYFKSWNPDLQG